MFFWGSFTKLIKYFQHTRSSVIANIKKRWWGRAEHKKSETTRDFERRSDYWMHGHFHVHWTRTFLMTNVTILQTHKCNETLKNKLVWWTHSWFLCIVHNNKQLLDELGHCFWNFIIALVYSTGWKQKYTKCKTVVVW